ncbi:MAG: hypothetical protein ACXVEF_38085 [Polyangiales bacterium]
MASPTIEALKKEIDDISNTYGARFAGHSRVTRDPAEIDELVRRTQTALKDLEALPAAAKQDPEVQALLDTARENVRLYEQEKVAITDAKREGPEIEEFSRLGTQANFVFARYRRHFAGKSRATRDLGLLAEMVDDLVKIQQRMQPLVKKLGQAGMQQDLDLVTGNIDLYKRERGEINDARQVGTQEEQADMLAECANGQFKVYQDHFAGKSRATRRPQLLQRMIANLETIKDRMQGLVKAGLRAESNTKNIAIVEQNLAMYRTELAEIKKARASMKLSDLMGNLGGAANDTMTEYRENYAGKARKGRDLDRLSKLCDELGELIRQMADLGRAEVHDFNVRNLAITTDNLVMLETEHEEIAKA